MRHAHVKAYHLDSRHACEYLTYLANERDVSAATQNVAFSAILFLFRHILGEELDGRDVQELLGHKGISTAMIYTHVMNRPGINVRSPLDME